MRWPAPGLIGLRPLPVFAMEIFTKLFGNLLAFVYHCFDRIVIHGYLSALSRPEQVVHFFRQVLGIPVVSKEILSQRTADYQNWVEAFARNHHTPIAWAEKGVRKEDHVLPWRRRMTKNSAYGVYYIFKSMEQGPTFRISRPKYPTQDPHYRILAHQRSRFTHYYFYIRDEVLGPMVMRVASFFPFQGCSTLFVVVHIAQGFEASEGSGVAILGDGVGLIEPQDIISEAAQSGEDARVAADARGIFAEGDVAGVVLFVFDTPMFANGIGGLAGTDGAIGQVERGFA